MEETFEQKVIRNVQGNFAVYKTSEVVGNKSLTPNLEWVESDEVDKFFAFARNLGAKVIYIAEGEEEDEEGNQKSSIVQVGFLHQGIIHHINLAEDEEDENDEEYEYVDEDEENSEESDENSENDYSGENNVDQSITQETQTESAPSDFISQRNF